MNQDKQNLLQQLLVDCMLEDLKDPDKCTPGLYQVVRGVLNDNKHEEDSIPKDTMDFLEARLSDAIPFKKETGT
tara:strand:- start:146 stop:367 length:222 start_codon:yes stop_codon:yes gene_type:complete